MTRRVNTGVSLMIIVQYTPLAYTRQVYFIGSKGYDGDILIMRYAIGRTCSNKGWGFGGFRG